jgi:hypothetical protein
MKEVISRRFWTAEPERWRASIECSDYPRRFCLRSIHFLRADEIDLTRTQSEGVAALKLYLHYAEHGRMEMAHSHGDAGSYF